MSMSLKLALASVLLGILTGTLGFVLLGMTVHSGGVGFVVGNVLMPGVYVVGLFVSGALEKHAFWLLVWVLQFVYALVLVAGARALFGYRQKS